jgi:hypothetical protein
MMSSAWRYIYDLIVIILSFLAVLITLALLRPPHLVIRRWVPHTAAWIASGMLALRGVAGMIVDGTSDPIWWHLSAGRYSPRRSRVDGAVSAFVIRRVNSGL